MAHNNQTLWQLEERGGVSVVIPALNEQDSVKKLTERLSKALKGKKYELIFVDDNSTDETVERLVALQKKYPVIVETKQGPRGKAYSLLQGFRVAKYDTIAMIDADLQYPPEALREMVSLVQNDEADVVVANRKEAKTGALRKIMSKGFRTVFGKMLLGFDVDVQSGLKVFRREAVERTELNPKSGWTFDLEFLTHARNGGYRIVGHDIEFAERQAGETKIRSISAARQIGMSTLKLRLNPTHFIPFHERDKQKDGSGFHYKGDKYVTHTTLTRRDLAVERLTFKQRLVLASFAAILAASFAVDWFVALVTLVTLITGMYFLDLIFNLYLIMRSFYKNAEIQVGDREIMTRHDWPRYTVFCPLYKEPEVVPQFIGAMSKLDYPKDKLEVMLLLEEDDVDTIEKISAMALPHYFQIVVVPDALPKTKPKACNYGLLKATGEYAVIYDAEDIPDPKQLKKAVIAFENSPENIGCIQAKLNYYNWNQNILTRLFTLEYSLWFDLVLTGLQSINSPIPLGGTSNHFRVADLRELKGWDPFNVTEDADLGMRIAKRGLQTAILDSVTLEEANSEFTNWLKQRSRWIKGYMQTYLVHMRKPTLFARNKFSHMFIFQLVVGGKIMSMLINPILWLTTIAYFVFPGVDEFITSLYLGPVFYLGTISLIFGNFLYMYYYMMGAARHQRPELIPFALLIPVYWLMISWAAVYALRDLIVRPFHWHKTKHGLHLKVAGFEQSQELEVAVEAA